MLPWPSKRPPPPCPNPFCLTSWCVIYTHPHTTPCWKHFKGLSCAPLVFFLLFFFLSLHWTNISVSLEVDVLPDKDMCLLFVVSAISATAAGFKVRWIDLWLEPSLLQNFPLRPQDLQQHMVPMLMDHCFWRRPPIYLTTSMYDGGEAHAMPLKPDRFNWWGVMDLLDHNGTTEASWEIGSSAVFDPQLQAHMALLFVMFQRQCFGVCILIWSLSHCTHAWVSLVGLRMFMRGFIRQGIIDGVSKLHIQTTSLITSMTQFFFFFFSLAIFF